MSELLPRCTHPFGYCAKTKAPKGNTMHIGSTAETYKGTPKCKLDWRICEHYRILTMTMHPLPQSSPATPADVTVSTEP